MQTFVSKVDCIVSVECFGQNRFLEMVKTLENFLVIQKGTFVIDDFQKLRTNWCQDTTPKADITPNNFEMVF